MDSGGFHQIHENRSNFESTAIVQSLIRRLESVGQKRFFDRF